MANAPPKSVVGLLAGVEGLKVVEVFSEEEVHECEVAKGKLSISNKVSDVVEFGSNLFEKFNFEVFVILVPEESLDVFYGVSEDTNNVVDVACILSILAEEISLTRSADDVLGDGGRFSKLEIAVDEVR